MIKINFLSIYKFFFIHKKNLIGVHPALLQLAQAVKNAEASINRDFPSDPVIRLGAVSA